MGALNQNPVEAGSVSPQPSVKPKPGDRPRSIQKCNFRTAGRLSNEDARSLTAVHESFARYLATSLDAYLGTGVQVKLEMLDQLSMKEHGLDVPGLSYIVPFSGNTLLLELDNELVFPMVEVLMGGRGDAARERRELSEIEEEIMQDVTLLIARQAEFAWSIPDLSFTPGSRIKASALHQFFSPTEKVTVLKFMMEVAGATGSFRFVFPTEFLKVLMKKLRLDQPQKKIQVWGFHSRPLRERILDCDMEVTVEMSGLKVSVRDVIALQPGSVLKFRAPIHLPGMLTAGGRSLFEAVPVRNGLQRAAQLGRQISLNAVE